MANTSDMNTPEHATVNSDSKEYIDKLQSQLIQHQIRRVQGRDYAKILRQHNTPAQWYKNQPSTTPRSIYFYDPNYQKYRQQQQQQQQPSKTSMNIRFLPSTSRATNQSKSRTKCSVHYSHNHQQKLPSRLQSIPTLPPIMIQKKSNEE